jgi:capsid protein
LQHQVIVFQMCRPIWRAWIQAAILAGALPAAANDAGYLRVKWIPPGFAWVDPLKDIKAGVCGWQAGRELYLQGTKTTSRIA